MAKFSTHTFVHDGLVSHSFAPGDEVPGWADGLVGPHVLVPEVSVDPVEEEEDTHTDAVTPAGTEDELGDTDSESNDESESDTEDSKPKVAAAPDFTGSAPRRRQSRK